jgi:hypothetical protein
MKSYTDDEINSLIEELRTDLPELLKSEGGKQYPSAESGGQRSSGHEVGQASSGHAQILHDKAPKMGKEGQIVHENKGGLKKDAEQLELEKEGSAPEGSPDMGGESASEGASEGGGESETPPADGGEEGAEAPPGQESPEQQQGDEQTLEQAYAALPDDQLQMHYEALRAVVMQRMSGGAGAPAAPGAPSPDQGAGGPPGAGGMPPEASGSPAGGPPGAGGMPPEMGAGGPPEQLQASEAPVWADELKKATDEKVASLERQLAGLTGLLETMITRPQQKAFTSMAQFVAKSELEKPKPVSMNRKDVLKKLNQVAQSNDLKKSDRDLINRYVLAGDVDVNEISHLLK